MQININSEAVETLDKTARRLCDFFNDERDFQIPIETMKKSLEQYLNARINSFIDEMPDQLLSPHDEEHQAFRDFLPKGDVFQGFSAFSFEKFAAVVGFFLQAPNAKLSKTKLNKLSFFSDFFSFKKFGKSITGSEYKRLPFGPVVEHYEELIKRLETEGYIGLSSQKTRHGEAQMLVGGSRNFPSLNSQEIEILKQVETEFGKMTAEEISERSHREIAYRDTKEGEAINYQYAKVMR